MAGKRQWTVHPNRSELGPDEPGCNGHFRVVRPAPDRLRPHQTCRARIVLPQQWSHLSDTDGAVMFADADWRSVGCQARIFAHHQQGIAWEDLPPPLGFTIKGRWHWWDGTTTAASILEGADAAERTVRPFLERLFPGARIELADLR